MFFASLSAIILILTKANGVVLIGSKIFDFENNVEVIVELDDRTNLSYITLVGPSTSYFAVGFGKQKMQGSYAIIVDGEGEVTEKILAYHSPGATLNSSVIIQKSEVNGNVRVIHLTRDLRALSPQYFDFSTMPTSVPVIYAWQDTPFLSYHGQRSGIFTLTLAPTDRDASQQNNFPMEVALTAENASKQIKLNVELQIPHSHEDISVLQNSFVDCWEFSLADFGFNFNGNTKISKFDFDHDVFSTIETENKAVIEFDMELSNDDYESLKTLLERQNSELETNLEENFPDFRLGKSSILTSISHVAPIIEAKKFSFFQKSDATLHLGIFMVWCCMMQLIFYGLILY